MKQKSIFVTIHALDSFKIKFSLEFPKNLASNEKGKFSTKIENVICLISKFVLNVCNISLREISENRLSTNRMSRVLLATLDYFRS